MGKRGRVLIAAAAVVVLAVLAWTLLLAPSSAPEPVYKGKPLSYWLQGYGFLPANGPTRGEANAAISEIGTNAIPTLLRMLRAHDSPLKAKFLKWAYRYPYVRGHFSDTGNINMEAAWAFRALGPGAASAIPELTHDLDENASPGTAINAAMVLGSIGPEAHVAVPSLLRAATNANNSVRNFALAALGQIHSNPNAAVPVLIKALNDPWARNRANAAYALEQYRADAKSAIPALVAILRAPDTNSNSVSRSPMLVVSVRSQVEQALQQIDPETYARVVTNAVQAPIPYR